MPSTSGKSLWLARLVLLLCSIAFAVAVMEVAVRLLGMDRPLVWRPDPVVGWWQIPGAEQHWTDEGNGSIHINSGGLRDVERSERKDVDVLRIAVFGDSMTEGVQVDLPQTYCQVLERQLTRELGRRVEVLNFGVNGYSPLQEYLLYRDKGHQYSPDVVLHAIFLDNDVADLHPTLASGQRGGPVVTDGAGDALAVDFTPAEQSFQDYNREPAATVRRLSAVYRVASNARYARLTADTAKSAQAASGGVPRRFLLYSTSAPPAWDEAWDRLERVITQFSADVHRNGSQYVIVGVPAGQVVNTSAWTAQLEIYPAMKSVTWDLQEPEKRLAAIAERHAVPFIAATDRFTASPERAEMFFGRIGHFTPRGHEMMADVLKSALLEKFADWRGESSDAGGAH